MGRASQNRRTFTLDRSRNLKLPFRQDISSCKKSHFNYEWQELNSANVISREILAISKLNVLTYLFLICEKRQEMEKYKLLN